MLTTRLLTSPSFFYSHTPTTNIYTLSLHDALPISHRERHRRRRRVQADHRRRAAGRGRPNDPSRARDRDLRSLTSRSEEHTSELQSRPHLVCRLLLEKKKT